MTPIKTTIFTVSILAWVIKNQNRINSSDFVDYGLAPAAGLEPATSKLTASCSTTELRRNTGHRCAAARRGLWRVAGDGISDITYGAWVIITLISGVVKGLGVFSVLAR